MARAKKPKKEPIEPATRLVVEHWIEPKKEDWQIQTGSKVYIGQYANGAYYLKMEKARRRRYQEYDYTKRAYTGGYRIQEYSTQSALIKVSNDDIDSIIDGLITLKELIKNNRSVKSTITEVKP